MDVTIREMVLEDLDAVGRLEHEAFEHPLSVTAFRASLRNRYKKNFVAVTTQDEDRKIAGVCTMRKTPEHVWISNVCVTTRMQGCGIARAMLEHATNAAQSRLNDAVDVMASVMLDTENPGSVRTQAADALIRNTLKLLEINDISRRLDALEKNMEEDV